MTINGISFQVIGVSIACSMATSSRKTRKISLPNDTLRYAFNQIGTDRQLRGLPKAGIHARSPKAM